MKKLSDHEFIQFCMDELSDINPVSKDGNEAYERYAKANAQLTLLSADEANMKIVLSPVDKQFLTSSRAHAKSVSAERQKGRRYLANAGSKVQPGGSRELTDNEQAMFNQTLRAIEFMTADERSRQNTSKAVVNFGQVKSGTLQSLSLKHPAKVRLWQEYVKKSDEVSALEATRLVNKLKCDPNPILSEVRALKYLVDKVMPELTQLGANHQVDTSRSYNVLKSVRNDASAIIAKKQEEISAEQEANKTA